MVFNPVWEETHQARDWGKYPSEDLIRWTFRNFGKDHAAHRQKHMLDLGCGQGNNTWFLAREGFTVFAIDGSETATKKAKERMKNEADVRETLHRVMFHSGDFTKTRLINGVFDGAIDVVSSCHNCIHSLPDIYREVERLLKPDGKFFCMFPTDKCSPEVFQGYGVVTMLDETDLRLILQEHFDIKELTKSSYQPAPSLKVEHWVVSAVKRGKV